MIDKSPKPLLPFHKAYVLGWLDPKTMGNIPFKNYSFQHLTQYQTILPVSSTWSLLYTVLATHSLPCPRHFISQNLFKANQKWCSIASPNYSHTRFILLQLVESCSLFSLTALLTSSIYCYILGVTVMTSTSFYDCRYDTSTNSVINLWPKMFLCLL